MSLLFIDGMGHYDSTRIDQKYTVLEDVGGQAQVMTWEIVPEGRFANCLKKTVSGTGNIGWGSAGYVDVTPLMTQTGPWAKSRYGVCGFALKVNDLSLIGGGLHHHTIWELEDGANSVLTIGLNPTGTFGLYVHAKLFTGDGAFLLTNSIQGIRANEWAYIEVKWYITPGLWGFPPDDPSGYVILRVNGVEVLSYAGSTGPSTWTLSYTGVWTTLRLLNTGSNSSVAEPLIFWLGDLYVADEAGGAADVNDFLGDVTIDKILPEAIGAASNWTPTSGDNWDMVEEIPPDDDVTTVSAQLVGTRDSYVMEDVPAGSIILGYQTLIYARKETEGGAGISPALRIGGVYYDATAQGIASTSEYRYVIQPYDTNPATLAKITEAEINAAEAGEVKTT